MFKYIVICTIAVSCSGLAKPMGLGQSYENKPAFFHKDFYTYKTNGESMPEEMPNIIVQKESAPDHSILEQRRSS